MQQREGGGRKLLNQEQVFLVALRSHKLNHAGEEAGTLLGSLYMACLSFSSGNASSFKTQRQCCHEYLDTKCVNALLLLESFRNPNFGCMKSYVIFPF